MSKLYKIDIDYVEDVIGTIDIIYDDNKKIVCDLCIDENNYILAIYEHNKIIKGFINIKSFISYLKKDENFTNIKINKYNIKTKKMLNALKNNLIYYRLMNF